jgi:hypothetical protein
MSKEVYNLASECHLRPAVKAVLQTLAWYADPNGRNTYPSVGTISSRTDFKRRTVQKVLRELEAIGIILATSSRLGGRSHSTRYEINMGKLQELKETANCKNSSGRPKGEPECKRATATSKKSEQRSPEQQEHEKQKKAIPVLSCREVPAQKMTEQPQTVDRITDGLDQDRGNQVWSVIREHIRTQVDSHSFDIWVNPLHVVGCVDDKLSIRLPGPQFDFKRGYYSELIKEALISKEIDDIKTVRFV